ncbi:MAG: histidine kinase [Oscillospiraceae bacterium]|nr:histidine kinase [Oscillospiraceae bacterium]
MSALVDRIGLPMFVQVVIEIWNGLFLIIMIASLHVKGSMGHRGVKSFTIPYTTEILVFYHAIFLYDLCNVLGIVAEGETGPVGWWVVRIADFFYYLIGAFQTLFFLELIRRHVAARIGSTRLKAATVFMELLHVPLLLLLLSTPLTGALYHFSEDGEYVRGPLFLVWNGLTFVFFIYIFIVTLLTHRRIDVFLRQIIDTSVIVPFCGVLLNTAVPQLGFNNISVTVAALIIFIFYERHRTAASVANAHALDLVQTELAEKQLVLEQSKNVILMAQIQPQFINNHLMALRARCRQDPALYDYATNFARYMRAHFDALGEAKLVTFEQEMQNIEAYLALEQESSGERIHVVYDIEDDSFLLPAFSVQPLVENAVRHGILNYEDGGTLRIGVHQQDGATVIEIVGEGDGRCSITQQQSERRRIGEDAVRARLRSTSQGTLTISDTENKTTATITLREEDGGMEQR